MDIFSRFIEIINNSDEPLVLELGACDGYHTDIMISLLEKTGKNYCFIALEPVTYLAESLRDKYANNRKVKVYNEAISDKNEQVKLYVSGGGYIGSSSLLMPKKVFDYWGDMSFTESDCAAIRLDSLMVRDGLADRNVDFIWADIQGAEKQLILGGEKTLAQTKYLYTEFCNDEFYEGQLFHFDDICELLPNFELVCKYQEESPHYFDVLLKNNKLK